MILTVEAYIVNRTKPDWIINSLRGQVRCQDINTVEST